MSLAMINGKFSGSLPQLGSFGATLAAAKPGVGSVAKAETPKQACRREYEGLLNNGGTLIRDMDGIQGEYRRGKATAVDMRALEGNARAYVQAIDDFFTNCGEHFTENSAIGEELRRLQGEVRERLGGLSLAIVRAEVDRAGEQLNDALRGVIPGSAVPGGVMVPAGAF